MRRREQGQTERGRIAAPFLHLLGGSVSACRLVRRRRVLDDQVVVALRQRPHVVSCEAELVGDVYALRVMSVSVHLSRTNGMTAPLTPYC